MDTPTYVSWRPIYHFVQDAVDHQFIAVCGRGIRGNAANVTEDRAWIDGMIADRTATLCRDCQLLVLQAQVGKSDPYR